MSETPLTLHQLANEALTSLIGEHARAQLSQALPDVSSYAVPALGWLRSVGAILTVLFGFGLVVVLLLRRSLDAPAESDAPDHIPEPASGGAYAARWGEITRHMDSAKEAEWKLAIIEADKLIDLVLKRAGFSGSTIGERLSNAQVGQIQTLEGLWEAHKVRNRIAHDLGYFLRYTEAKRAIDLYAETLREFQAL